MSGHSKWSTIKRKKALVDGKKGRIFNRLVSEIQIAARSGVEGNPRLKRAIDAAKAQSVPLDNIEKAVKRATGDLEGAVLEEITYEAYGPAGVAILIKVLTDNRNRTVAAVRHALNRNGGSLATANAVAYQFKETGIISIDKDHVTEEILFDLALEAEDINDEGLTWEVLCSPDNYEIILQELEVKKIKFTSEIRQLPSIYVPVQGHSAEALLKLLDVLDNLDDVQSIAANFDIDESELESLS